MNCATCKRGLDGLEPFATVKGAECLVMAIEVGGLRSPMPYSLAGEFMKAAGACYHDQPEQVASYCTSECFIKDTTDRMESWVKDAAVSIAICHRDRQSSLHPDALLAIEAEPAEL